VQDKLVRGRDSAVNEISFSVVLGEQIGDDTDGERVKAVTVGEDVAVGVKFAIDGPEAPSEPGKDVNPTVLRLTQSQAANNIPISICL
jgi:hypothetical protein